MSSKSERSRLGVQMSNDPIVGGDILRLLTAGMYNNPLVLYREYLQNSADAVASHPESCGSVSIDVDPLESQITIMDDGEGLSPANAARRLVPIGNSAKNPAVDRGFRGIGRLSALAFAENIHFTTRTCASESVTRVSWNSQALRDLDVAKVDAEAAIKACTTISSLADDDWPNRFFQVTIDGVTRHVASTLLNQDVVRRYIGEICPVPMASSFPLAKKVQKFLGTHMDYFALDVRVNGDTSPIKRPFGQSIPLTEDYTAPFERLEKRLIPKLDENGPAAILWLAHTPYAGSISRQLGIRGLRVRAGNIQIGNEAPFEHLFHETRFNGWCVGEVHIVDSRIVPNGRRDYFEPSPHLRNLENHLGAITQEISSRCRGASSQRNKLRAVGTAINQVKRAHDLATSGYLLAEDAAALLARERERIDQIRRTLDQVQGAASHSDREALALCEGQLGSAKPNSKPSLNGLNGVSTDSVAMLQSAFGAVAKTMPPDAAFDVIESILRELSEKQVSP